MAIPHNAPPGRSAPAAAPATTSAAPAPRSPKLHPADIRVVGIGVSTGGPAALQQVLPQLPADFPVPVVVVQHMPPGFTAALAQSLDRSCRLRVSEAKDGERLEAGRILIAPAGRQLRTVRCERGVMVRLTDDPPEHSCRPAVDYLFRSLAAAHGPKVLGVVMTGMGEDGWLGSRAIHEAGGLVLAQDQATSTVWGMPRGPVTAGHATAVALPLLAAAIVRLTTPRPV